MSVMAAEAGTAAAPMAAQAAGEATGKNRGVLLALGIVLLWLAGVAFFFAFEGVKATEQADTTGGGLFKAMLAGMSTKAQAQENKNANGG